MNAHPLHSRSVSSLCLICTKKQKKTNETLSKLRAEMKKASERLAQIQKKEEEGYLKKYTASVGIDGGGFEDRAASISGFKPVFRPIVY